MWQWHLVTCDKNLTDKMSKTDFVFDGRTHKKNIKNILTTNEFIFGELSLALNPIFATGHAEEENR